MILKHPHTYERLKHNKNLFKCTHPDCTHIGKKELIRGKRSTCTCGETFILTNASLELKNPHCPACGKSPKPKVNREEFAEISKKIFGFPEQSNLESESDAQLKLESNEEEPMIIPPEITI